MVGRLIFASAQLPMSIQHDPIAYLAGLCTCFGAVSVGKIIISFFTETKKLNGLRKSISEMPLAAYLKSKYTDN